MGERAGYSVGNASLIFFKKSFWISTASRSINTYKTRTACNGVINKSRYVDASNFERVRRPLRVANQYRAGFGSSCSFAEPKNQKTKAYYIQPQLATACLPDQLSRFYCSHGLMTLIHIVSSNIARQKKKSINVRLFSVSLLSFATKSRRYNSTDEVGVLKYQARKNGNTDKGNLSVTIVSAGFDSFMCIQLRDFVQKKQRMFIAIPIEFSSHS